jgi:hypothetical protein
MNNPINERGVLIVRPVADAAVAGAEVRGLANVYHLPELHVVGQAAELVQGGGGSYADNNRARQY